MPTWGSGRIGGSLAGRLFLIIAVFSLVPLFASNLLGYLQTRRYLTKAALRDVRNVAELQAERTAAYSRARIRALEGLAADPELIAVARPLTEGIDRSAEVRLEARLEARLRVGQGTARVILMLAPEGRVMARAGAADLDLDLTSCRRWTRSLPGVVGFEYGGHEPDLWLAAPVRDGAGRLLGRLCARYTFDIHHELRLANAEQTNRAALYLLDERGRVVCGSFGDIEHGPAETRAPRFVSSHGAGDREPIETWLEPSMGRWAGRRRLVSGQEMLAAFAPIPELGWGLLVAESVTSALADLDRLKRQAVAASALLAAALMVMIGLAARALARRLGALSRAARRLADGALGERVPAAGPREIAELAIAFNQMSAALHDAHTLLEDRIRDRTAALRRSQAFIELLFDSVERWVVVIDARARVIKANAAATRLFGAIVGRPYPTLEGRIEPAPGCVVQRTFETGRGHTRERYQQIGGEQHIVSLDTYPMLSADGRVESVVQMGRVVTAERARQAQLVHSEKMAAFGLLAAGVAHDIGNPLAAIQSQLALTPESSEPAVRRTWGIVRQEVERIGRLLRGLVDFARRRRDTVLLISVNQVVGDVTRLLEHDPRARSVRIVHRLAPDPPGVRAREDDLMQVLLNLGINALDAMSGGGGELTYETRVEQERALVVVRDTGCGIPAELIERVFEPFFTTKVSGKGTGLGLFVSRSIVERLGGGISIESSAAEGTVFVIDLPAAVVEG